MTETRPDVYASRNGGVLRIVVNRPARMNALTTETLERLATIFVEHAQSSDVRVAVLEGEGKAFCTGADLADVTLSGPPSADTIDAANALVQTIREFPFPVVAAVRGPAAGVGVSLALACDLVLAAESSYFLLAFTKVGLMPDGGATALVAASIGRARDAHGAAGRKIIRSRCFRLRPGLTRVRGRRLRGGIGRPDAPIGRRVVPCFSVYQEGDQRRYAHRTR